MSDGATMVTQLLKTAEALDFISFYARKSDNKPVVLYCRDGVVLDSLCLTEAGVIADKLNKAIRPILDEIARKLRNQAMEELQDKINEGMH
jgi:hypothetical protein